MIYNANLLAKAICAETEWLRDRDKRDAGGNAERGDKLAAIVEGRKLKKPKAACRRRVEKVDSGHEQQGLWMPIIADTFDPEAEAAILEGDSAETLRTLPDRSIKLIITSPPYNIGKAYEKATYLNEYLENLTPVVDQLIRVLAEDGSLCWQVGNYVENSEIFPLDIFYYPYFKGRGLKLRNRVVWYFEHGLHCSKRFSGRYEVLLWFTKTDS